MSIKFRSKIMDETPKSLSFKKGETVKELVSRAIASLFDIEEEVISEELLEKFVVSINLKEIPREFWETITVEDSDEIFISPELKGGDFGQVFKQVAIIVATIVATVTLGPGAGATVGQLIGGALAVASVTIGTTLLLNSLIPPPNPSNNPGGSSASSIEGSQMYSLGGQSNAFKPYGFVPKVYGTHRLFPNIAASPYTTIEAEPGTGKLVQYFHAVYDFGLGPMVLDESTLSIGDTPISSYAEVSYNLVDLNKPAVDEGVWDNITQSEFTLYKGDNEKDGTTAVLNIDKSPTAQLADYRITRNASPNPANSLQTISLDFVCPRGLIAFGSDGSRGTRTIELSIEFSKVGENIWRRYDNLNFVDSFKSAGGITPNTWTASALFSQDIADYREIFKYDYGPWSVGFGGDPGLFTRVTNYGYKKGETAVELQSGLATGTSIRRGRDNKFLAKTQSETPIGGGFSRYTLDRPLSSIVIILQTTQVFSSYEPGYISQKVLGDIEFTEPFSGLLRISGNSQNQVYATASFTPKERASYKVRITRDRSYSSKTFQTTDALTLYSISTRFDRAPILTDKRHLFLELKVKATNQINGNVDNLSGTASSVLEVYDPNTQTWNKEISRNPAWVFSDLLTGEVNKRAIDKSRLDTDSLVEWAAFSDEVVTSQTAIQFVDPRFSCDFILDYETTLQQLLNSVGNAAQASLNLIDGKYGVLIDREKTVPVQIFTPRNSWGFSSSRKYTEAPDAINVRFVDPGLNWKATEITVYDDGFDKTNADRIDDLSTFACTSQQQAWRFGRYMMAQNRLRQETISISTDFEYLVCTRGDYVQITQDVMKVGGRPARVRTVSGTTITIDDGIETISGLNYGYTYRSSGGSFYTDTLTVVDFETFELDGEIPDKGDLIVIGEVGDLVFDCIVASITPQNDLTAQISLVEKADAIYDAETGVAVPEYDPQLNTDTVGQSAPNAVEDLEVVENTYRVLGRDYQYYIGLDWDAPDGSAVATYEVYRDVGGGYNLVEVTKDSDYEYIVREDDLDEEHGFKVLAVSATGEKISLVDAPEVFATPLTKVTPPSDLEALNLNITGEVLQLDWSEVLDEDLDDYLIRYNPNTDTTITWENTIPLVRADKNSTSIAVQARTGTYFIKAIDLNKNESELPALAVTHIPELFDLNIIDETNDFPALNGELERTKKEVTGGALVIQTKTSGGVDTNEYYSSGYYYYADFLDLGEIYTVRLQSLIEAEGFTVGDLMDSWNPLSDVEFLSNARTSEWDVESQVRYTANLNTIGEWTSLDIIDPLSEGVQDNFGEWVKFTMGDFTGRIFQFRLKLISNKASVTPRVFDGIIRSDMPDRTFSLNNVVSEAIGTTNIAYTPPFKGPETTPNVQITQDSAQNGDYFVLANKSLSSFDITFYDESDVQVSRQFDVTAKGYGRKANQVI